MKRFVKIGLISLLLLILAVVGASTATHLGKSAKAPAVVAQRTVAKPNQLTTIELQAVEDSINQIRIKAGLSPLASSSALTDAATNRCSDMATNHYFSHTAPDGAPWYTALQKLTSYKYAGENLEAVWAPSSVKDIVNWWMDSPEHKANILTAHYTNTGLASCEGIYQNKDTVFVVQEFDA